MVLLLKAQGERSLVTSERVQAYKTQFEEALLHNNTDEIIFDISCMLWKVETLQILLPSIPASRVIELRIDDIVASLPTDEGLAVYTLIVEHFQKAPLLRVLSLIDNAVGERGIQRLQSLFTPKLQELHLFNLGMSLADCQTIRDAFQDTNQLQVLKMGRNQMGIEGAQAIGRLLPNCPHLRVLEYTGNRPLPEGTKGLMRGLAATTATTQLKELYLNDCDLGHEEEDPVQFLLQVIERNPNLEVLDVGGTSLDWEGTKLVLETLLRNPECKIKGLDLEAGYDEGKEVAEELGELLQQFTMLEDLNLAEWMLEDEGIAVLLPCLTSLPLKKLNLKTNTLEKEGIRALVDSKIDTLEKLDIGDNEIPQSLADRLKAMYTTVNYEDDDIVEDEEGEESEEDELTKQMAGAAI